MTDCSREARGTLDRLLAPARSGEAPAQASLTVGGRRFTHGEVTEALRPHMTERRLARIEAVVAGRTYAVAPVVEGLVNVGNVSAVMRTAEALGYQALHVITTGEERFKQSERTSQGAQKWLDLWRWPAPEACAEHLRGHGYRIVAMHLRPDAMPIGEIDFTKKTALVFGNERNGVSEAMQAAADACCIVPMAGFAESFNVSVAAAVALYHAREDRLRRQGRHADLTPEEQDLLRARFCLRSVSGAEKILRRTAAQAQRAS